MSTDRGHKHSDGSSVVYVWISKSAVSSRLQGSLNIPVEQQVPGPPPPVRPVASYVGHRPSRMPSVRHIPDPPPPVRTQSSASCADPPPPERPQSTASTMGTLRSAPRPLLEPSPLLVSVVQMYPLERHLTCLLCRMHLFLA